jgi:aspartate/methionine/tyrosine aminotransferase
MRQAVRIQLVPLGVSIPFEKTVISDLFDDDDDDSEDDDDDDSDNGLDALKNLMIGREDTVVAGGYFIYIRLPDGISAEKLARKAQAEQNLIVAPESMGIIPSREKKDVGDKSDHDQFVRLTFAWEDETAIREGVERLADALRAMQGGENEASSDSDESDSRDQFS